MSESASLTPEIDYKSTLNLPHTDFKMKAGAATREPEIQAFWETHRVYDAALAARDKIHRFLLHDGPPYLSSDKIHIGTALNKILKDIVTRYKTQRGFYAPYVPGYDGHGLPIENAVVKSIEGGRRAVTPFELRQRCRVFALKNLSGQEANFKRLGVWGHWEKPYITIDGAFEATQIRLFWAMYRKGHVYKGLKPVYWCPSCETALADAEVEYQDHTSHSIDVRFQAGETPPDSLPEHVKSAWATTFFVIWTTTPWTLPANLGLALHPDLTYVFYRTATWGTCIVAEALLVEFQQRTGLLEGEVVHRVQGRQLECLQARHPFYDRTSLTVLGDHVTSEAGTGVVHTAPGHGHEDYLVGQQYDLGMLSPLDDKGVYTQDAGPPFEGQFYEKANPLVIEVLMQRQALLHQGRMTHSYPHCWRCHQPVIFRATPQWFVRVDGFRQAALDEIHRTHWIPARGEQRITSMVENRTDWCISRQRVWGVPIPVLYCAACHEPVMTDATVETIATCFERETSDAWWQKPSEAFVPEGQVCPKCAHAQFEKEMDIMDVWFDSGVTHTAVVEARADELGHLPVELYLEGSDQHRGWFQSALLTSVATRGERPYQCVLTHGFVLDAEGRKMSKSLGNVVDPMTVIQDLGADVLRLWVASVDYTNDVRIGKEMLSHLADVYRKVRNTLRFILGNLAGFEAATDRVPVDRLSRLDRYILHRLQGVVSTLTEAFDAYAFHRYYQVLQNFCATELSALYFDVTKDTLYTAPVACPERRAVQTVLFELLSTLTPMLVPVMPHLAEDIWLALPEGHKSRFGQDTPPVSILLAPWPGGTPRYHDSVLAETFERLLALKDHVNLALEAPRAAGRLGSTLEASIWLHPQTPEARALLETVSPKDLAMLFVTSSVVVASEPPGQPPLGQTSVPTDSGIMVYALAADGEKCIRCWKYRPSVGKHPQHTQICESCVSAVQKVPAA